jgi:hypothetical protein
MKSLEGKFTKIILYEMVEFGVPARDRKRCDIPSCRTVRNKYEVVVRSLSVCQSEVIFSCGVKMTLTTDN